MHDTDDLKDTLSPQEREKVIRRLGTTWIVTASCGLGIAVISTLVVAVTAGAALDTPNGRLFVDVGSMLVATVCGGLLVAGLVEWLQRPQRTLIRQAAAVARGNAELGAENARIGAENALLLDKNGQLIYRLVDAFDAQRRDVGGRLDRIEKAIADLPDYGKGVIDGVQMRADALGSVE